MLTQHICGCRLHQLILHHLAQDVLDDGEAGPQGPLLSYVMFGGLGRATSRRMRSPDRCAKLDYAHRHMHRTLGILVRRLGRSLQGTGPRQGPPGQAPASQLRLKGNHRPAHG